MATWLGSAAPAEAAPQRTRARPARQRPAPARPASAPAAAPRPRARRRPEPRRGIFGGALWIALLGALLGGVVALNVAVLQLNIRLDELGTERANLRATNAGLSAQLSSAGAAPRIEATARKRLGLEPSTSEQTAFVELDPGAR